MPEIYLPLGSAAEAALVPGIDVFGAADPPALCAYLSGSVDGRLTPIRGTAPDSALRRRAPLPDLVDVIGHPGARRALEVAAAGGHHLLMVGPPGAGRSMLAARLPSLLPPMADDEALSSAAILSANMLGFSPAQWRQRAFRAPHHSSSSVALVGGRNPPQPGEITLAHLGVLFLDELIEFDRKRYANRLRRPASLFHAQRIRRTFRQRVNWSQFPCPCGWRGDPNGRCRCTPDVAPRYLRKLSGPLLDRIDIQIELPALSRAELSGRSASIGETSTTVARRRRARPAT